MSLLQLKERGFLLRVLHNVKLGSRRSPMNRIHSAKPGWRVWSPSSRIACDAIPGESPWLEVA